MKRFLIIFLALLLTVGTVACGGKNGDKTTPEAQPTANADATPASAVSDTPAPTEEPAPTFAAGTYEITMLQAESVTLEGDMLVTAGVSDTSLTLNADHTGKFIIMGQEVPIGWTDEGDVTASGYPIYTIERVDDETILFHYGEMLLTMQRSGAASAAPSGPQETEVPAETEAPAPSAAGEFPGAPYGSSDGKVDHATLAALYRWMNDMPYVFCYALTFDEIGAAVGKQGQDNQNNDGKTHSANWWDEDDHSITVTFNDRGDGNWVCCAIATTLSSSEYNAADISGFPKVASSTPAGTNPTESQTFEAKVGFSGPKVNVTAEIPTKNWYPKTSSSVRIYCAPNAEKANSSDSYFKIECEESLDKINFYQDSFENLTELEPLSIGGIEMQGRSYKYVGMNWIEYYGKIAEGVWVSIQMTGVDLSAGTETEAILMSMTFALQ